MRPKQEGYTVNQCPRCGVFSATFSYFCDYWLLFCWLLKIPLPTDIVLKCCLVVPKHKKAVMCLMVKTDVLDKPHSSMSYNAISFECSVNHQHILNKIYLNRSRQKTVLYINS